MSDGGGANAGPGSLHATDSGVDGNAPARSDGGAADFKVTIAASAAAVCPGQCAQLTAAVFGGVAPYRFSWQEDLANVAQVQVCPAVTTRYTVTVTDASADSEFSQKNAPGEASVTVTLADAKSCAAVTDGGLPLPTSRELCSMHAQIHDGQIMADEPQKSHHSVVDREGNVVVIGSFTGTLVAGETTLHSSSPLDGFVIKLDHDCNVLWAKSFGGDPDGQLWLAAVAGDDSSNIFLGGGFLGKTQLGDAAANGGGYGGFLMQLDPHGDSVWTKVYKSAAAAVAVTDLVTDAQQRLTMIGYAGADTNFGGGPLALFYAASIPFVAQLKTDGTFGWSRAFASADLMYGLANGPYDDGIILGGWASKSVDLGAGAMSLGSGGRYLAKLSSLGTLKWLRALPRGADIDQWNWWKGGLAVDAYGGILALRDEPETLPGDSGARLLDDSIEKYDVDGNPVWQTRLSDASTFDASWGSALAMFSDMHMVRFGSFVATTAYAGQTLVSRGDTDVALVEVSPDGEALSAYAIGGTLSDQVLSVAVDYDNHIFASYDVFVNAAATEQELVVAKLSRY